MDKLRKATVGDNTVKILFHVININSIKPQEQNLIDITQRTDTQQITSILVFYNVYNAPPYQYWTLTNRKKSNKNNQKIV